LSYRPNGTDGTRHARLSDARILSAGGLPSRPPFFGEPLHAGSRGALPQAWSAHNGQGEVLRSRAQAITTMSRGSGSGEMRPSLFSTRRHAWRGRRVFDAASFKSPARTLRSRH